MPNILKQVNKISQKFTKMLPGWIGLDVGSDSIKMAQVHKKGDEWELMNFKILPHVLNTKQDNLVSTAITTLSNSPDGFSLFSGKKIASALSMSQLEIQQMDIPDGSESEIKSMIQQNLIEQNNLISDREFLSWKNNFCFGLQEGMTQRTVISVEKKEVVRLANFIQKKSCQCEIMNVIPVALSRALEISGTDTTQESVAVFDWGSNSPIFTIVSCGKPIFTRQFNNCGYSNLINILCNNMGLTVRESEQILQSYQDDNSEDESDILKKTINELIAAPIKLLSREFGRTLKFIHQQKKEFIPSRLVLFGKGAAICNSSSLFQNMTEMESEPWTLAGNFQNSTEVPNPLHAQLGPAIALSSMAYQK